MLQEDINVKIKRIKRVDDCNTCGHHGVDLASARGPADRADTGG